MHLEPSFALEYTARGGPERGADPAEGQAPRLYSLLPRSLREETNAGALGLNPGSQAQTLSSVGFFPPASAAAASGRGERIVQPEHEAEDPVARLFASVPPVPRETPGEEAHRSRRQGRTPLPDHS